MIEGQGSNAFLLIGSYGSSYGARYRISQLRDNSREEMIFLADSENGAPLFWPDWARMVAVGVVDHVTHQLNEAGLIAAAKGIPVGQPVADIH